MGKSGKSRKMGIGEATSIGIGAMIGAGMFALIGIAVDIAGNQAYLSFMIAGVIALLSTYSVAKLAVQYPTKAGRVEYLNKAFGKGLFAGGLNLMMWIGYVIVTSLYARAFGEYAIALFGMNGDTLWLHAFSSGILVVFVLVNFLGAAAVGKSELVIVAVKVLILLGFGIMGITTMDIHSFAMESKFSAGNLFLAAGVVFMSYEGFGLVANTAEDIRNPKKTLPRALYISVFIVMLIYLLVCLTVIGNLSISQILDAKEYALAEAAKPLLGATGFTIMGIAALFSTSSAINATIYGPVHMLQETAEAGQAPKFFMRPLLGHESGYALVITGIIILIAANLLDMEAIAETGSMIFLLIYAFVNMANYILRKTTKSNKWIVLLAILGSLASFASIIYHQILQKSISVYLLIGIAVCTYIYQWINQKYVQQNI